MNEEFTMFPMNDTARKFFNDGVILNQALGAQMMDHNQAMLLSSQRAFNTFFDTFRNLVDVQQNAARAMQATVVDSMTKSESVSAA